MKEYCDLVRKVLTQGERRQNRTGVDTLSVFGVQNRYDLQKGFPLLTTKKVLFSSVVRELLWFLKGSTNINDDLTQHTPIWDAWADEKGELGPIYGHQWRRWGASNMSRDVDFSAPGEMTSKSREQNLGIDQIAEAIQTIKTNPDSRRIIVSAWNPTDLPKMALPACHLLFQFNVRRKIFLDLQMYQRSADIGLGVPFNIASYALLLMMVANECNLIPGEFVHTIGDAHIYVNHIEGLTEQINREPRPLPWVHIEKKPFDQIAFDDVHLRNYNPHPFVRLSVAV